MNLLQNILDFFKNLLQWWFIVEPWEQAVRVRFGKNVLLFNGGTHFRIPFFDSVYVQNVRRRLISIGSQTLTTKDRKLVTIHSTLGYTIVDVLRLQQTLHDADGTILQHVITKLAHDIATHNLGDCAPADVMDRVRANLNLEQYGLGNLEIALTSYVADIKTIRLINDSSAPWIGGASLNTVYQSGAQSNSPAGVSGR
jgi:regulator of protease activity HflC (stomatin/prohibitin superfamily)